MTGFVLDASALIALLLSEPGQRRVQAVIDDAAISTVNLAEVIGYFARNGVAEADIRGMLAPIPAEVVPVDLDLAYASGAMLPFARSAGLSLGDRVCLSLARRLDVTALTADRAWLEVAAIVEVEVELIR